MTTISGNGTPAHDDADIIKRQAQQIADLKRLLLTVRNDVMLREGNPRHYADLLEEVERTLRRDEPRAAND